MANVLFMLFFLAVNIWEAFNLIDNVDYINWLYLTAQISFSANGLRNQYINSLQHIQSSARIRWLCTLSYRLVPSLRYKIKDK